MPRSTRCGSAAAGGSIRNWSKRRSRCARKQAILAEPVWRTGFLASPYFVGGGRLRDALRAKRPYRDALPLEKVFAILLEDSPRALDLPCLEALISSAYGHSLVGHETGAPKHSQ